MKIILFVSLISFLPMSFAAKAECLEQVLSTENALAFRTYTDGSMATAKFICNIFYRQEIDCAFKLVKDLSFITSITSDTSSQKNPLISALLSCTKNTLIYDPSVFEPLESK